MAACWSSENATKAYIRTLKMEKKEKEPNASEFISALAAGNNAQVMVTACDQKMVTANLLALVSAAQQTSGQVTCISPTQVELQSTNANCVNFVVGNARDLLLNEYKDADFILIDCNLEDYEEIMKGLTQSRRKKRGVIVGFNAFCKGSKWQWGGLGTHLLPIGDGLLVTKVGGDVIKKEKSLIRKGTNTNWVVKIDKCTGEEHVFKVRSPHRKLGVTA